MLYSYNWLKEYLEDIPAPAELARILTMGGVEVDSVTVQGGDIEGVVTARITSMEAHPNADRLRLCSVTTGEAEFQIVCGATNMKTGDAVALALVGATLPGGFKIKKSKIRGVVSEGMMCSESELGFAEQSEGILILPIAAEEPLGLDLKDYLGLNDVIFEISVTPNRGDVLSIKGLAREIAALTRKGFILAEEGEGEEPEPAKELIDIAVEEGAPCPRYTAMVIEGVKVGPSPDFVAARLAAHGLRAVNNVVDVTNYILLELGQPMHAFDLDRIKDNTIRVRPDRKGESLVTIDGTTVEFAGGTAVVIADGDGPVAAGGIMGGEASSVTGSTTRILLESAFFEPSAVRRAGKAINLSSDSSYRFERGVDIVNVRVALVRAAAMIMELTGGRVPGGVIDIYPDRFTPQDLEFSLSRTGKLLGLTIDKDFIVNAFTRLGIDVRDAEGDSDKLICSPPSYRTDITSYIDLVEEAARMIGYDVIPATMPRVPLGSASSHESVLFKKRVKNDLVSLGFTEVVNYSFVSEDVFALFGGSPGGVAILNPLSEDHSVMRASLLPGLIRNLKLNIDRDLTSLRIFELGPVFHSGADVPVERSKAAGLIYGKRAPLAWNQKAEAVDFYDIKGSLEALLEGLDLNDTPEVSAYKGPDKDFFHPGRAASMSLGGKPLAVLGELHPELRTSFGITEGLYLFELDMEALYASLSRGRTFRKLTKFPASERDVALIVDEELAYGKIISAIRKINTKLIEKVDLFDVYYGNTIPEGKKSLAFRITYRSPVKTLTHDEVEKAHERLVQEVTRKFNALLRGA
ncbi:MAG: phenylalanine--tRNA ligase subunit beta [Thermodesulfobacteriota bacterium]